MRVRALAIAAIAAWALTLTLVTATTASAGSGGEVQDVFADPEVQLTAEQQASRLLNVRGMAPGDTLVAPITVSNRGERLVSYQLRSTTSENALAAQLDLTVVALPAGGQGCRGGKLPRGARVLYGPGPLGSTTGTDLVGGERRRVAAPRALAAGGTTTLCVRVTLPADAGNGSQGLATTARFDFPTQ